jgi:hypothetical protein
VEKFWVGGRKKYNLTTLGGKIEDGLEWNLGAKSVWTNRSFGSVGDAGKRGRSGTRGSKIGEEKWGAERRGKQK